MYNINKELVNEFLYKYNMNYKSIDFKKSCTAFVGEMINGLAGKKSCLKMIPTYISDDGTMPKNESIIALDAGGTNLRVGVLHFDEASKYSIKYLEKYPMPGTQGELNKDEFFGLMAEYIAPVIDMGDKIGFCFSFPTEIMPNKDGRLMYFNKEVKAKGIDGQMIGECLLQAIKAKGLNPNKKIVLLNDTVSTLLGGRAIYPESRYDGSIGFILGTGTNTCYSEDNYAIIKNNELKSREGITIINIESGGYDKAPTGYFDDLLDSQTINPGNQRFEKMIAGAYQGSLLQLIMEQASKENLLSEEFPIDIFTNLETKDFNDFVTNPYHSSVLSDNIKNDDDRIKLYYIVENTVQRAAKLVAINLASVMLKTGSGKNPCLPVCIAAEGTTFYKSKLFRRKLDYYVSKYLRDDFDLHCEFIMSEQLNIVGTAVSAVL